MIVSGLRRRARRPITLGTIAGRLSRWTIRHEPYALRLAGDTITLVALVLSGLVVFAQVAIHAGIHLGGAR